MSNKEATSNLIKVGIGLVVVIAIGLFVHWLYKEYTYSQLPKIPVEGLAITEEPKLRVEQPRFSYNSGLEVPRNKAAVYAANSSYVTLDKEERPR